MTQVWRTTRSASHNPGHRLAAQYACCGHSRSARRRRARWRLQSYKTRTKSTRRSSVGALSAAPRVRSGIRCSSGDTSAPPIRYRYQRPGCQVVRQSVHVDSFPAGFDSAHRSFFQKSTDTNHHSICQAEDALCSLGSRSSDAWRRGRMETKLASSWECSVILPGRQFAGFEAGRFWGWGDRHWPDLT